MSTISNFTASEKAQAFVSSIEKIESLRKIFKGDCVEMEGAAVAHVAWIYKIPFIIIRAISDKADHSAMVDFPKFVELASENSKKIVLNLLRSINK